MEVEKDRIKRKFFRIRKAIEDDELLYSDDIFQIDPIKGKLNPNSEIIITIIYYPKGPMQYSGQAYCNITCCEERLPIQMIGHGLGPKASFTNILNNKKELGDIYIDDKIYFTLDLENKGNIDCRY